MPQGTKRVSSLVVCGLCEFNFASLREMYSLRSCKLRTNLFVPPNLKSTIVNLKSESYFAGVISTLLKSIGP